MSNKSYTPSQIQELLSHPGVFSCTDKYLCFTRELKKQALDLYLKEFMSPKKVFQYLELPYFIVESSLPKNSLKDWKKRLNTEGEKGLIAKKKGRPKVEKPPGGVSGGLGVSSSFDELEYLRAKVAYLEEENKTFKLIRAGKYKHYISASSGNE